MRSKGSMGKNERRGKKEGVDNEYVVTGTRKEETRGERKGEGE